MIDPMLIFYLIAIWLMIQLPLGIVVGWWLKGKTQP